MCLKRAVLGIPFMFDLLPFFFPSFLVTMRNVGLSIYLAFIYHGPLAFATIESLLSCPLQNPLDHDNG